MKNKDAILSIAGFDPTGGAGILADSAVFRALGFHPLTLLTSVAAQGASRVQEIVPLSASFILKQLEIILQEFEPKAIKIGMLYSIDAVDAVVEQLRNINIPIVLDPIIKSSSGTLLIESSALKSLEDKLIPLCRVVTPNIPEARHFLQTEIDTSDQAIEAATELSNRWDCAVLLKGGHLESNPIDILVINGSSHRFAHSREHELKKLRGTGCALAAAIAAFLAQNKSVFEAVEGALQFLESAISDAYTSATDLNTAFLEFPK